MVSLWKVLLGGYADLLTVFDPLCQPRRITGDSPSANRAESKLHPDAAALSRCIPLAARGRQRGRDPLVLEDLSTSPSDAHGKNRTAVCGGVTERQIREVGRLCDDFTAPLHDSR